MPDRRTRQRVLDLVEAVRERPQEHPAKAMVALAGEPVRITVDRSGEETVVFVEPRPSPVFESLTPREREVAGLLAAGRSNQQIARELHIQLSTTKDHVHAVLRKTGLPSRSAVAAAWHGA